MGARDGETPMDNHRGRSKTRVVPIYIEKERGNLIDRAKAEADKQRRSLSWLVCEALEEYLNVDHGK